MIICHCKAYLSVRKMHYKNKLSVLLIINLSDGWTSNFQFELAIFDYHVHNLTKLVLIG